MPYDLGDPVPLAVFVTDDNGAPGDAGGITLTITKPDGTAVMPAVSHPATGTYSVSYAPPTVGRYSVDWVATGANASAYSDAFDVVSNGMIISLAEARSALRSLPSFTADDEDLRALIASATGPMEDICGPILRRDCDEWHDGGGQTVRLLQAPAISVTSVLEAYGAGYTRTLTLQNLDAGSFDSYGYTVDLVDAVITRRVSGQSAAFVGGRRNIHVVYIAGRLSIPPNLIRATRRLVRWLWQTEMQGISRPTSGQASEATVTTPSGYRVPQSVIEMCGAEVKIPGIA